MKKTTKVLSVLFLGLLIFTSCNKDEPKVIEPVDLNKQNYEKASASKGGIMFDNFWSKESGFDQSNPNLATLNAKSDFFRCKQCHAWDGLGRKGSYIGRAPSLTRPNVSGLNFLDIAKTKSPLELFNAMKATAGRRSIKTDLSTYNPATPGSQIEGDKMPNLNELLTDAQIWDIVKFMKEGIFDVNQLYTATYVGDYPTGKATYSEIGKDGNEEKGKIYYTTNCAKCHGTDGKTIPLEMLTLGKFVRSKPNEVQHKVKYGQLGTTMVGKFDISLSQMKDLYKYCSNTTDLPD
jgi:mono/diheme cytochrome c family protein